MAEPSPIGPVRTFARSTIVNGSYYAAACLSSGGASAIVADLIDRNGMAWFWFGLCLPIGPLYFLYASGWMMERQLTRLKRWKESGIINSREYDEHRKAALAWFKRLRYPGSAASVTEVAGD